MTWQDTRELAGLLFERYDTLDPRTVRLADLRKWVVDLEDFAGQPDGADDATLGAIQREWYEVWAKEYGG
jgi:FeS assembly protein IscX